MTELSPAAQAVLDAVCANTEPDCDTQHLIAAALRAAADQSKGNPPDMTDQLSVMYSLGWDDCAKWLREIAAELEGQ